MPADDLDNPSRQRKRASVVWPYPILQNCGDYAQLICPRCGSGYMHQGDVVIHSRGEDADIETQTTVDSAGHVTTTREPSALSDNPSSRRQGMVIRFECEGCGPEPGDDDDLELTIAQHKGETHVMWRRRVG